MQNEFKIGQQKLKLIQAKITNRHRYIYIFVNQLYIYFSDMQVDQDNFKEVLPTIIQKIQQSDFVAFDCQFTGLVTKLQRIQGQYPNHIQFYQRIKETAYNFSIIQLGIAAFIYKDHVYKPYVYNIYINPVTWARGYNNVMICQVESMEFLAKNKLDFNRVFCKGIKSKRLYSNDIQQKHQYNQFPVFNIQNLFLSPEEEEIVNQIQEQVVKQIIHNSKLEKIVDFKNRTLFAYFRHKYPDMLFDKTKKNMKIFEYSVRFRPMVHKQVEVKPSIDQKQQEKAKEKKTMDMSEQKMEGEQIKEKQQQKPQQIKNMEQQSQASITKIFQILINNKKPIIGHFPNLDIGLIYQHFLHDLPQTYQQFCHSLTNFFPYIFDTKVLSRRLQNRLKGLKVDLASLFKACSNPKLLKPYSNFDITGLQSYVQKQHEAGYDAFITGCSFIGMTNYLAGQNGRINLQSIQQQNWLLYSRYSGQVSVSGNGYASNSINYPKTIIIQPMLKALFPQWRQVAKMLSKFGSLTVCQDHGQIYYVFEQPQNIVQIINALPELQLRYYSQRRIIKARDMYNVLNA